MQHASTGLIILYMRHLFMCAIFICATYESRERQILIFLCRLVTSQNVTGAIECHSVPDCHDRCCHGLPEAKMIMLALNLSLRLRVLQAR